MHCLGGMSASGCVSLSIPRSVSCIFPVVPAGMSGNRKGPAVIDKQVVFIYYYYIVKGVVIRFEPALDSGEGTDLSRPNPPQGSAEAATARIKGLGERRDWGRLS